MQINQALYGLKPAGNSWYKSLSTTSSSIKFEPSRADPDIWIRMSTNSRGEKYRAWIVVYIDNLLAIIEDPKYIMDSFSIYDLKDIVSPLDRYLGANVGKWLFSDGSKFW